MKPTLFAIATVFPLLAGVIPNAHAVECAAGVVRVGCAGPNEAVVAGPRGAAVAGPNGVRVRSAAQAGTAAIGARGNTATKAVQIGCASYGTACQRNQAHRVRGRSGMSLGASTRSGASPVSFVNDLGIRALAAMRKGVSAAARQGLFRQVYREYFDTEACARSALGSYWSNATAQQRQEFVLRYEDYVVIGYSTPPRTPWR